MPKSSGVHNVRIIVVVSDLHAGSTVGLLPDDFVTHEGNHIEQNAVQKWLWTCWRDAMDVWLPGVIHGDSFALVANGDMTEGCHHKTKQIISPDTKDHVTAAQQLIEPLAEKATHTFVTEGTEVHTGTKEHGLAKAIKAVPDPDTGKDAWERLALTVAGTRCVFRHHIDATSRTYLEASALSIHLGLEQLEAAKNGEPIPRVLACAHRHRYGEFRDASGLCFVTPPWQVLTRHGHKVVPAARTRPGLVVLDWRNRPDGEIPEVHARTYRAPHAKGATI